MCVCVCVCGHSIMHLAVLGSVKLTLGTRKWTSISFTGSHSNLYGYIFSPILPCLFRASSFYYVSNLWLELNTLKLPIMQSSLHIGPYLIAPSIFLSVLFSNVLNLCSITA